MQSMSAKQISKLTVLIFASLFCMCNIFDVNVPDYCRNSWLTGEQVRERIAREEDQKETERLECKRKEDSRFEVERKIQEKREIRRMEREKHEARRREKIAESLRLEEEKRCSSD
jgi:hypothetical protein